MGFCCYCDNTLIELKIIFDLTVLVLTNWFCGTIKVVCLMCVYKLRAKVDIHLGQRYSIVFHNTVYFMFNAVYGG